MCKFGGINYYENELDLKKVIVDAKVHQMEEALNVCDLSSIVNKYEIWKSCMPTIKPYYAVKCNDDTHVLNLLVKLGTNFDCASMNEIKQVLDLGASPERIIFANPCKPISHLKFAKEQNISTCTADNEFELYKMFKCYPSAKILLRFRYEAKDAQCPLGDKFGCDAENDIAALLLLASSLQLDVTGTSFHVGSGCGDLPAFGRAITLAKRICNFGHFIGYQFRALDIGGGFPGNDDEKFRTVSKIINGALQTHFPGNTTAIIAEPGRFFVASAYTLICKIHAKRQHYNMTKLDTNMYYLNDGVYGSFNCILYDHQVVSVKHFKEDENDCRTFKTTIWGPSCDALDKIVENVNLPNLYCGDLIAFPNMGAYTMPIASPFNGFPLPKTIYFMKSLV